MHVGVVVGRFQVGLLHDGHRHLIDSAMDSCDKLVIFLGISPGGPSTRDPLDYQTRQLMVQSAYPQAVVLPKFDMANDYDWSMDLEKMIWKLFPDHEKASLFGGRDSCLDHYVGRFEKVQVSEAELGSGTKARGELANLVHDNTEFRHGAIHTAYRLRPMPEMAVDMALLRDSVLMGEPPHLLLGKKPGEKLWRFPGGKVDLTDQSLEAAARRELKEETGIFAEHLTYIGSHLVNDWRYRKNPTNKIMTALFVCREMTKGQEVAGDDLDEVEWLQLGTLIPSNINPAHVPLMMALRKHLNLKG